MDSSQTFQEPGPDILAITRSILYYVALPVTSGFWIVWKLLQLVFAPLLAIANIILAAILLPVKFLVRFETIIIYLGFAALIGLLTGFALHISSTVLVSFLGLENAPESEKKGHSASSFRAEREQRVLEKAWQGSTTVQQNSPQPESDSLEDRYAQWLERNPDNARKNLGLFGQTILEEDDSSMDGF